MKVSQILNSVPYRGHHVINETGLNMVLKRYPLHNVKCKAQTERAKTIAFPQPLSRLLINYYKFHQSANSRLPRYVIFAFFSPREKRSTKNNFYLIVYNSLLHEPTICLLQVKQLGNKTNRYEVDAPQYIVKFSRQIL